MTYAGGYRSRGLCMVAFSRRSARVSDDHLRLMLVASIAACARRRAARSGRGLLDDAASVAATMKLVFQPVLRLVGAVHDGLRACGLSFLALPGRRGYDRMLTSHVTKKVRKHIAASRRLRGLVEKRLRDVAGSLTYDPR